MKLKTYKFNKSLIFAILLILIVFPAAIQADDFREAKNAAKAGDFETAVRLWTPMANNGHKKSQYYLGRLYRNGSGVEKDLKKAFELIVKVPLKDLLANKDVRTTISNYARHVDQNKIKEVFTEQK